MSEQAAVDYAETGAGPAVLFVPGSYSTAAAWRPIQRAMEPRWRMAGTSILGYGGSTESRTRADFDMRHEVELMARAAQRMGGPIHLVGHSFGGTVALAAALAGRFEVASLSLFEANPLGILREAGLEETFDATQRMSRAFEVAVDAGEPDAPSRIIDFWGKPGDFDAMPEAVKTYCRQTAQTNVIDWRTACAWQPPLAQLRQLRFPILLARGAQANPAMIAITDTLHSCWPHARKEVVPDAGHFLVSTHAVACAQLLSSFLKDSRDAGSSPA
jgi:pimeloyl-ACP methyl ester carboxylesterase